MSLRRNDLSMSRATSIRGPLVTAVRPQKVSLLFTDKPNYLFAPREKKRTVVGGIQARS